MEAALAIGGALASGTGAINNISQVVQALSAIKGRDEATKRRPVDEIMALLGTDIRVIRCFIEDSKWKSGKKKVIKEIERQIGDAIHDGEVVLSRYRLYLTRQERRNWLEQQWYTKEHNRKLEKVVRDAKNVETRISTALGNRWTSHSGSQADNVNLLEMLQKLSNDFGETHVADAEAEKALQKLRRDVEANTVGFVQEHKDLVNQLISGDSERSVISITGMVGTGKTTLAKKLYNDKQVISHFDSRAWINLEKRNTTYLVRQIVWGVLVDHFLEGLKLMGQSNRIDLARANKVSRLNDNWIYQILKESKSIQPYIIDYFSAERSRGLSESITMEMDIFKERNQQKIKKKLIKDLQSLDGERLKRILSKYLEGKKYLIVFDDMWDTETWEKVKDVLPPAHKSKGCRILITTRINRVARHANSSLHCIRKLNATESLELFCKKLFRIEKFEGEAEESNREVVCKDLFKKNGCSEVENLAKDLAKRCEGLPLSIVQLADVLAGTEKRRDIWSRILDVNSHLVEKKPQYRDSLALSYRNLPSHLKQCFLYFGTFPKNYEIPVRQLIQLWIAEEFIEGDPKNMEDIAEDYLQRLIDENLIQPLTRRSDGGVKTCVTDGLLLELCMSKIEDLFLKVHRDANLSSIDSKPRKLSLQGKTSFMSSECPGLLSVRSFSCFPEGALSIHQKQWEGLRQSIELVQVLNLGDVELESIPEDIGDLNQLRYLKLKGANLRAIPDSIHKLRNLLTLDVRSSAVNSLPKGIWKLQKLRHLYLSEPTKLPNPSSQNHSTFHDLQVLSCLPLNKHFVNLITSRRFPCVRKLRVYGSNGRVNLPCVRKIWQNVSLGTLTSLTNISLVRVTVDSSLINVLGGLPNLLILKILGGRLSRHVRTLQVTEGFVKLGVLKMARLPIRDFILNENAMQGLHRLIIKECENLEVLPLEGLTSLEEVHGHALSPALNTMLEKMKEEGCQFKIVIHPAQQAANGRN